MDSKDLLDHEANWMLFLLFFAEGGWWGSLSSGAPIKVGGASVAGDEGPIRARVDLQNPYERVFYRQPDDISRIVVTLDIITMSDILLK